MLTFFLICLVVGALVGFLAGLFGIGGGLIIVPVLVYLLPMAGIPDNLLMSSALGTSFATIVVTGFSSAQRHHKLGNIVWDAVKILAPVIMVTTFISGLFIGKLDKAIASKIFACLVVYLALKMVLSIKPKQAVKTLTKTASVVGGILIGIASSAAGIGGGGFIVPFLNSRGIDMKKSDWIVRFLWNASWFVRYVKFYYWRLECRYAGLLFGLRLFTGGGWHYRNFILYFKIGCDNNNQIADSYLKTLFCVDVDCHCDRYVY